MRFLSIYNQTSLLEELHIYREEKNRQQQAERETIIDFKLPEVEIFEESEDEAAWAEYV